MKRLIKPIIIILVIVALIMGAWWLIARHQAAVEDKQALSFRDFYSIDRSGTTGDTGTDLSSDFTTPGTTDTGGTTGDTFANPPTPTTSIFTNNSPASTGNEPDTIDDSGNAPDTTGDEYIPGSGEGTPGTTTTKTVTINGSGIIAPKKVIPTGTGCTDADLNIVFTQDELAQLQQLQNRFYAVADKLRTDADAATELGNYNRFAGLLGQIDDLTSYCQGSVDSSGTQIGIAPTLDVINTPISYPVNVTNLFNMYSPTPYKNRTPTPFWHAGYAYTTTPYNPQLPISSTNFPDQAAPAYASQLKDTNYLISLDGLLIGSLPDTTATGEPNGTSQQTKDCFGFATASDEGNGWCQALGQRVLERMLRLNLW